LAFLSTQVVHSRLVEGLRPDNPLAQVPYMTAPFSLKGSHHRKNVKLSVRCGPAWSWLQQTT